MQASATVNYHIKSTEPQTFQFDVGGIIGNLLSPELVPTKVNVLDLRDNLSTVNFDDDGITFENYASRIRSFDSSENWKATYENELSSLLKDKVNAQDVIVFDHTVRIDDPSAERQPARNVHNDYSQSGAEQRLIDIVGKEEASLFQDSHYGFVNVWRPVDHIIKTSPLGFIRPSSMRADDWMTIGLIYPDRLGQILGVAVNEEHEWFYLSDMIPDEVAIFNIYDNKGRPHLAHSALDMDNENKVPFPRKSIESRTLVRYSK